MSQLLRYLKAMPRCGLDVRSLLTNGKVEIQLKTLLGIAWVASGASRNRSYLMDKRLDAPLDFLAFEAGRPKFWIEVKCDFAADGSSVERSATSAVNQVGTYSSRLRRELRLCPAYIVHFLCPLPDDEHYPDWVDVFDPLLTNDAYTPARLTEYYLSQGITGRIRTLTIDFEPRIDAVLIDCARSNASNQNHRPRRAARRRFGR